ncbi:hypothetical protein K438DRAFT_350478 [Mycena galopus ATCC 62051]|nr:hypothetical protein K438DRAFT_350478 [Mycena galopus ATCC 62051]
MLNTLIGKKSSHQSGTGWKPSVWTDVVDAVQQVDPTTDPMKDKAKVISKLNDVKDIFTLYLFVEKFSGMGWDDEEKHAINTPEYVQAFLVTHGKTYTRCFKKPCPFYTQLDELYDGLTNRATGEHVIHFSQKSKHKSRRTSDKENPTASVSASASTSSNSTTITTTAPAADGITPGPLAPTNSVINIPDDGDAGGGSVSVDFADELTLKAHAFRQR